MGACCGKSGSDAEEPLLFTSIKEELEHSKETVTRLQNNLDQRSAQVSRQTEDLKEVYEAVAQLKNTLDLRTAELKSQLEENERLKKQVQGQLHTVSTSESTSILEDEHEVRIGEPPQQNEDGDLKARVRRLTAALEQSTSALHSQRHLQASVGQLEQAVTQLQHKLDSRTAELVHQVGETRRLQGEVESVRRCATEQTESAAATEQANATIAWYKQYCSDLSHELKTRVSDVSGQITDSVAVRGKVEKELQGSIGQLEGVIAVLQQKLENCAARLAQLVEENGAMQAELQTSRQELEQRSEELALQVEENESLKVELQVSVQEWELQIEENDTLRKKGQEKTASLQQKLSARTEELETKIEENERLQAELQVSVAEWKVEIEESTALRKKLEALQQEKRSPGKPSQS